MADKKSATKGTKSSTFSAEERDTTMNYGVEEGAKSGFARIDEVLARLAEVRNG
jgi:hypothetical protein